MQRITRQEPQNASAIVGVVLAAGRSRRMGYPKALLDAGGETFVAHAVGVLRGGGCGRVVVIVPPGADAVADIARAAGAGVLVNPEPDAEQVQSLRLAIRSLAAAVEAVVELPVDYPGVRASTVHALVEAFSRAPAPVMVSTCGGKHGHPTLFAREAWPELLRPELAEGARTVVHAHARAGTLCEVPVDDPGTLADVDTPADYDRLRSGGQE